MDNAWLLIICAALVAVPAVMSDGHTDADVIIIESGAGGIGAAKVLANKGIKNILILEPSAKVGGTVKEAPLGGYTFEIGVQMIEGTTGSGGKQNNPIYDLAIKHNISMTPVDYDDWKVRDHDGVDITDDANTRYDEFYKSYKDALQISLDLQDKDPNKYKPDSSFRSSLRKSGWHPMTPLDYGIEYFDVDFSCGSMPEISSARFFYDYNMDDFEDISYYITDQSGFSHMFEKELEELFGSDMDQKVLFNKIVRSIETEKDSVKVTTSDDSTYTAKYALVTFTTGSLQNDMAMFRPELPEWKQDSINEFVAAFEVKILIQFPSSFWDDVEWLLYANNQKGFMSLWLNWNKIFPGCNVIQTTVIGEHFRYMKDLPDDDIIAEAVTALKKIYGDSQVPEPSGYFISREGPEPKLHYTGFSNWPRGYPAWQKEALAAPVGRLYFANDATYNRSFGYLQSAYLSGENVGKTLSNCIKNGCSSPEYQPVYMKRGCTYSAATNYDSGDEVDDGSCEFPISGAISLCYLSTPLLMLTLASSWLFLKV